MLRVQILNRSEKTVNMIEINLTDDRNPYKYFDVGSFYGNSWLEKQSLWH